jgi:hypothetical protein
MNRSLLFGSLAAITLLLESCGAIFGRPERGITVREKTAICFRQSEQAHILASVRPSDCYSMRCTRPVQESGTAVVDQRAFTLDFRPRFVLEETDSFLSPCSRDCAGGGGVEFDLGQLEVGLYDVSIWDEHAGVLSVTSGLPWKDQCLSNEGEH